MNAIDIGAYGGLPESFKTMIDFTLSFDPFLLESETNSSHRIIKRCAFDKKGSENFYVLNKQECSSLRFPNYDLIKKIYKKIPDKYLVKETIKIKTINIDRISKNIDKDFHFLKIDSQGAELPILKGAIDTLKQVRVIEIESYNIDFYKNASLYKSTNDFLIKNNFQCIGHLRQPNIYFNDFIYINKKFIKSVLTKNILHLYGDQILSGEPFLKFND